MVRNLKNYLLGLDDRPDFIFALDKPRQSTQYIDEWWFNRWAKPRILRGDVLDKIQGETLVYPIRHNARVVLPKDQDWQLSLM